MFINYPTHKGWAGIGYRDGDNDNVRDNFEWSALSNIKSIQYSVFNI